MIRKKVEDMESQTVVKKSARQKYYDKCLNGKANSNDFLSRMEADMRKTRKVDPVDDFTFD